MWRRNEGGKTGAAAITVRLAPSRRRRGSRGQSLVEFALLIPVLLLFVGVILDMSRLYQAWVNLESATSDAAQYIASTRDPVTTVFSPAQTPSTDGTLANNANATRILHAETSQSFTPSTSLGSCAAPTVTTSMSYSTDQAASGGTAAFPAGTAIVVACEPFRTLFPYPFFTVNGSWTLKSQKQFTTLVGR